MDAGLNAATGGLIQVSEEPATRKQLAEVPPFAADAPAAPQRGFKRPAILDRIKAARATDDAAPVSDGVS
jgi:hypothetical protein